MPTAGYPNPKLVSTEYSEEDSRDAQVSSLLVLQEVRFFFVFFYC